MFWGYSQLKMTINFLYLTLVCEYSAIYERSMCLNLNYVMCSWRCCHCRNEIKVYFVPFCSKCINFDGIGAGHLIPKLRIII